MNNTIMHAMFQWFFLHIKICAAFELLSNTLVFGENVDLTCIVNETEIPLGKPHSRYWSGGPYSALLCKDGVSANRLKYHEKIVEDESQYRYILQISNFAESDVGYDYICSFGEDITRSTLQLNEENFEYIPRKETTVVTAIVQHGTLSVNVHFDKVWPTPVCEIIFEEMNNRELLIMSKRKNGKLYSVDLTLQYEFKKEDCSAEILISCQIGTKQIEVQRKQFNICQFTANSVLLSKPVVFGQRVQLACTTTATEIPIDKHINRSWSYGPFNELIIKNGVSTNPSKYNEVHGKSRYTYILEIINFSESDLEEYRCEFGVHETGITLQLNEEDYEYLPTQENVYVTSSLKDRQFNIDIHLVKVWPTPVCAIIFDGINYAKRAAMSKRKNGKLYHVNISLQHVFRSDVCSGELIISCQIGSKTIDIQRIQFNACISNVERKDWNVIIEKVLVTLIKVVSVFVLVGLVIVLLYRRIYSMETYLFGDLIETRVELKGKTLKDNITTDYLFYPTLN